MNAHRPFNEPPPPPIYHVAEPPPKADLFGVWFHGDAPPQPVPMLIERLLPAADLSILAGQSGAGKSFVGCDASAAVMTKKPFFGCDVTEKTGVIYIAAEGASSIPMRIEAALAARGFQGVAPFALIKEVPDLANDKARRDFIVEKIKPISAHIKTKFGLRVGMVVVDTIGSACTIKDENAAGEMNALCRGLREIGDAIGAATLPIAHYGKSQETGILGSSATRGFGESVISILADRDELTGTCKNRRMVHSKNRHGEEGPISNFELHESEITLGDQEARVPIIVLVGGEVKAGQKPFTAGELAYVNAIAVKMSEAELCRPFGLDGPEVKAVTRESVRDEFYASWTADAPEGKSKPAAKRQAFNRAERALKDKARIGTRTVLGRDMVWTIDRDVTA